MSIEKLDLGLLQVLHLVLEERSVAGAARRLHVTPSAISNALARLRAELDDPLVIRRGRGIAPTPRALELAPAIARALHDLDAALFGAGFDPRTCTRRFTLALADAGQLTLVPQVAARLAAELPRARLRVVGIDSLISLGDLGSPEVDLHLGLRARGAGLHFEPLFDERTVLVARRPRRLTARALADRRHVGVEMAPGRGFRDPVADAYRKAGIARDVVVTVPTFAAAAAVVARTELVATVPASFAAAYAARFGVHAHAGPPVPRHAVALGMGWHDRTHADAASIAFRALVRGAVTELAR